MINKALIISLLLFSAFFVNAQIKDFQKIENYYNTANYEKCIEKAKEVNAKYPKASIPLYYIAFSNLEIYKTAQKLKQKSILIVTLNNFKNALKYDTSKVELKNFSEQSNEIHDTSKAFAQRLYLTDKDASGFFFKSLVEIYNDTTPEFRELFMPKVIKIQQDLAFMENSGPINQTDIAGNRQGVWVSKYPDGVVKSEIFFKDNHPAGVFRKYYQNGKIKANMYFDDQGIRNSAILYAENGEKVAMGYYFNKQKDSLWQYFIGDSIVIAEENYKRGVKDGSEKVYSLYSYPNIIEEKNWKNGAQVGVWTRNYPNGKPKFTANYKDGKRSGKYQVFDETGQPIIIGNYENNLPHGIWNYWDDSTKKYIKVEYLYGTPKNLDQLTEKENILFKNMEKMQGKIEEPEDYVKRVFGVEAGGGND